MADEVKTGATNAKIESQLNDQEIQAAQTLLDDSRQAAKSRAWSMVWVIVALIIGIAIGYFML